MKLSDAEIIANRCKEILKPYCDRLEIGGSIRRKKPEVKDIELIVIPHTYKLEEFLRFSLPEGWIIQKGKGKYKMIQLPWVQLDLFIQTPKTWAMNYWIRTGSADYIHQAMIRMRNQGYCSQGARLCKIFFHSDCPQEIDSVDDILEEADIYRELKWDFVEPEKRT